MFNAFSILNNVLFEIFQVTLHENFENTVI